jgi:hypothetical protein
MPVLGFEGERYDLLVKQGAKLGPIRATMTNGDNTPFDLTDITILGRVVDPDTGAVMGNFDVSYVDRPGGVYEFSLAKAVTVLLSAGREVDEWHRLYFWDLEMESSSDNDERPLYYGELRVRLERTPA